MAPLLVLAIVALGQVQSVPPPQLRLQVKLPDGKAPADVGGTRVVARKIGDTSQALPERTFSANGTSVSLGGLSPGLWQVTAEIPGHWALPVSVGIPAQDAVQDALIRVWPSATIGGSISVPPRAMVPPELEVSFTSAPRPGAGPLVPQTIIRCPVRDQRWSCTLPADVLDVTIRSKGFIPEYYWSLQFLAHSEVTQNLLLKNGTSVAGFVVDDVGQPAASCKVRLAASDGEAIRVDTKGQPHFFGALTNNRGFFQIRTAPAGSYRLVAEHTQHGRADAEITVSDTEEVALKQPVVLEPPLSLAVQVDPHLDPSGTAWRVRVNRMGGQRIERSYPERPVADDGTVTLTGLLPGKHSVVLTGRSSPESAPVVWAHQRLELTERQVVYMHAQSIKVTGTVKLGRRPIRARLGLGVGYNKLVDLTSDEHGQFSVSLPKVIATSQGDVMVTAHVTLEKPPLTRVVERAIRGDAPEVSLDIDLPNGRIEGTVVNEAGNVPDRATIRAFANDGLVSEATTSDGQFTFVGLEAAEYRLEASGGGGSAEAQIVKAEESPTRKIRLLLRDISTRGGVLLSETGAPIAGASIMVMPLDVRAGSRTGFRRIKTDGNGLFSFSVPKQSRLVGIYVFPPNHPISIGRHSLPPGDEVVRFSVAHSGGQLEIRGMNTIHSTDASQPYLFYGGHAGAVSILAAWGGGKRDADRLTFPNIAAGEYALCKLTDMQASMLLGQGRPTGCSSGRLDANGTLVLEAGKLAAGAPAGSTPGQR